MAPGCWPSLWGHLAVPLLALTLKVLISFWDNLGIHTVYPLGKLLNQIPDSVCETTVPCRLGEAGTATWSESRGAGALWEPGLARAGRRRRPSSLNAKSNNFLTEGWGAPGALIRPRSPQFGHSAAAEIRKIRAISQPPERRELTALIGREEARRGAGCLAVPAAPSLALAVPPPLSVKVGI